MIVYLAYVEPFLSAEPLFGFEPVEPGASFPAAKPPRSLPGESGAECRRGGCQGEGAD